MSELFAPCVSIAPTRRRRFLWAAWWSGPVAAAPFRKPDAAAGGARSRDEALRAAEAAAGRPLVEIEGRWARAWARVLEGEPPFAEAASPRDRERVSARRERPAPAASIWHTLGVRPDASVADIKRAFRARALLAHPDHGGDPQHFRELRRAYVEALARRGGGRPRRG